MNRIHLILLIFTILLSACHPQAPQPISTPSPLPLNETEQITDDRGETLTIPETIINGNNLTLFVEPAITHQTITDVTGGNFINVFSGTTDPLEPVSIYNLEHLDVRVARVRMTLEEWEPINDDDDPKHINWEAFQDTEFNHATFQLMGELQERGTEIIATSWDLPDWLVSNPNKDTKRFVPYEQYPEMVETITAWLLTARDQYGVEPDYVSFNEPDVGAYVSIAPFEATMLIEQAGKRFDELGLNTKWLIADTSNIDGSVGYARTVLKNETIHPYLGVFANHSWDSDSPDSDYIEVRDFALANNLEVWCTETGSHAFSWRTPEKFPTNGYAVELARIYSRVIKLTGTSAILYWEMMGTDYWINDGTNPYPSFHVIRQLGEQIPPGSIIVETSNNSEDFYSVAAQAPDHFVVLIINTGEEALKVNIDGLPDGVYSHIQTTESELESFIGTYETPRQRVSLKVPGMSIHVLTTNHAP
jgi:ABC-type Fe3+-hydroxamate transport system substrate-binding protein